MSSTMDKKRVPQGGFTLIEVMIALLIGVIGIVVMMQTFAVSEGFKRTSTSGTDAQVNGSVALYMLEREIRTSGYGMNGFIPAIGLAPNNSYCDTVRVWSTASGTGQDVRLVPFEINPPGYPAGDANTDTILITFGTSDSVVAGVQTGQTSPTAPFTVQSSKDGFRNGDLVVGVQPNPGVGWASCVLHELTATQGAAGNCGAAEGSGPLNLGHGVTSYRSSYSGCNFVTPKYNSSTGIKDAGGAVVPALTVGTGGQLYNLGQPSAKVYAIRNNNLTWCDIFVSNCTIAANYTIAVNDIVSLRAVYGRDTTAPNQDFSVDVWDRTPMTSLSDAARVMAVMIEVTARSGVKEKPSSGTVCDAHTDPARPDKVQDWIGNPSAPGVAGGVAINLASTTVDPNEWKCYRYRIYQTRVPIRNMSWRP